LYVCEVVSSFRPVIGGAQTATEALAAALHKDGVDVVILTRRYSRTHARKEVVRGVPVHRLGVPGSTKWHAITFGMDVMLQLALHLRRYRVIHVQNIDTPMLVGLAARILLRRRLVATIHGESKIIKASTSRLGRLRLAIMRRFIDRYTSINPEVANHLRGIGVPADRIRSIPNGIDMSIFHPPSAEERSAARSSLGIPADAVVTLYIGRFVPVKRIDLLIDAWAQLPRRDGHQLLIGGEGTSEPDLRALAARRGVEARFDPSTPDVPRYLHASDVFVLPTGGARLEEHEGLSVALMEAMATGLSVIVTSGPGNDVLVPDASVGWKFPIGASEGLASVLEQVLASPERRSIVGAAAHESIERRYSIEHVARLTADLYAELAPAD
jgi:glycosyltransferase involved in cell wall biosynthesis